MRSPQRFFFLVAFVIVILALLLEVSEYGLNRYLHSRIANPPFTQADKLTLARYYLYSGRLDEAIEEYKKVLPTLPEEDIDQTLAELLNLLIFQDTSNGKLIGLLTFSAWAYPSKLYILAFIIILAWLAVTISRYTRKRPLFAIMPFQDSSSMDFGEKLPQAALDRMYEVIWFNQNLDTASKFISENLEVPILSMKNEADSIDTIALLETALRYSFGINDFPLTRLFNSTKLWLEQPKYVVRGSIDETNEKMLINMLLINRDQNSIEKAWHIELDVNMGKISSRIVDSIIYPLLFHFTKNLNASRWESLRSLQVGLEEFILFKEQNYSLSHLQNSRKEFEFALKIDPQYSLAQYNLGVILLASGETQEARIYFKDVSASSSDPLLRQMATYNYGVSLFHQSQDWAFQKAIDVFQELLAQVDPENSVLTNLIRGTLATTYAKKAEWDRKNRIELINLAVDEADYVLENQTSSQEAKSNALAAKGFAYYASKDYEQAIPLFIKSLEYNPESIQNLLGLGQAYLQNNQKEEAFITFQNAAKLSPFSGYASYRLGDILYRHMDEHDDAIEVLERAPQFAQARLSLGKIYLEDGLLDEALEEFRAATQLNKKLSEGWVNIAWTILELDDDELYEGAELAARRALQLERNSKQLWHRHAILSQCLLRRNKNELALKEALKAVELSPNKAQAHYYLSLALYRLGRLVDAKSSARKAISLDEDGIWNIGASSLVQEIEKKEEQANSG